MKIYEVNFSPIWPVPYGLIICAKNKEEALEIAHKTIKHQPKSEIDLEDVYEVKIDKSKVIFYESGDYWNELQSEQ